MIILGAHLPLAFIDALSPFCLLQVMRAKKKHLFDWSFTLAWAVDLKGVGPCTGTLVYPDVTPDGNSLDRHKSLGAAAFSTTLIASQTLTRAHRCFFSFCLTQPPSHAFFFLDCVRCPLFRGGRVRDQV
jgi:hypothetical protein